MSYDPTCPNPLHRLGALVGESSIQRWRDDGAPSEFTAVAMALVDLPEHLYARAVELLIESGYTPTEPGACRANPHAALLALAAGACKLDGVSLDGIE